MSVKGIQSAGRGAAAAGEERALKRLKRGSADDAGAGSGVGGLDRQDGGSGGGRVIELVAGAQARSSGLATSTGSGADLQLEQPHIPTRKRVSSRSTYRPLASVDERGNALPRNLFYTAAGGRFVTRFKWRGENFLYYLEGCVGGEDVARERDRLLICCFGPADAAARLVHPAKEYASERFYREMFASPHPPKVGVHDGEPGALAARRRVVEYLRRVGALEGPGLSSDATPPPHAGNERQQPPAAPTPPALPFASAASNGAAPLDGSELPPNVQRVRPSWRVGREQSQLEVNFLWGELQVRLPVKEGLEEAAEVARARDRLALALFGTAAPAGLCRPLAEYAEEAFFRELFGGGEPPGVGVHDPEPGTPPARARLLHWLVARCPCFGKPPGTKRSMGLALPAEPDDRAPENVPLGDGVPLPPNVYPRRVDGEPVRFFVRFNWRNAEHNITLRPDVTLFTARRVRDAILIAMVGPEEASNRGLCYRLEVYREQAFYRALFGEGERPRVGLHDPEGGSHAGRCRLRSFLVRCGLELAWEHLPPSTSARRAQAPAEGSEESASSTQGESEEEETGEEEGGTAMASEGSGDKEGAPAIGLRERQPRSAPAGRRLRSSLRSHDASAAPPPLEAPAASADASGSSSASGSVDPEAEPELPPNIQRVATHRRLPPEQRRYTVKMLWRKLTVRLRVKGGFDIAVTGTDALARARDRLALALFGTAAAARLCRPLAEYAEEPFFRELFGGGARRASGEARAQEEPGASSGPSSKPPAAAGGRAPRPLPRQLSSAAPTESQRRIPGRSGAEPPPQEDARAQAQPPSPEVAAQAQQRAAAAQAAHAYAYAAWVHAQRAAAAAALHGAGSSAPHVGYGYGSAPLEPPRYLPMPAAAAGAVGLPGQPSAALVDSSLGPGIGGRGAAFPPPPAPLLAPQLAPSWAPQARLAMGAPAGPATPPQQSLRAAEQLKAGDAGPGALLLNVRRLPQSGDGRARGMRFGGDVEALLREASRHFGAHLVELWDKDFNRVASAAEVARAARESPIFYALDAHGG
eukprot:tig00000880_g5173.t1